MRYWRAGELDAFKKTAIVSDKYILSTSTNEISEDIINLRTLEGHLLVRFRFGTMDGQCGAMMVYNLDILGSSNEPKRALVNEALNVAKQLARYGGYSKMIASQVEGSWECNIMQKWGFRPMLTFVNQRTKNSVILLEANVLD